MESPVRQNSHGAFKASKPLSSLQDALDIHSEAKIDA